MKKVFILLFGLVFGNYRELLKFVQRIRLGPDEEDEIEHREFHEFTVLHPAVGKAMEKLYADYLKCHNFEIFMFMDRMIERSLGGLLPVKISSMSLRYQPIELEALFNGNMALYSEYRECLKGQLKGLSPLVCIKQLIDANLKGVKRQHAKAATFFLEIAKRIFPSNGMPAFSTPFRIKAEVTYLEDLYKYLCKIVPSMADDRRTLLPEVIYVIAMFRYIYHMASFMNKIDLSQTVFRGIKVLHDADCLFANPTIQAKFLPTPHAITVQDQVTYVYAIVLLGVSQSEMLEKDIMSVFITDGKMYVSFPHYFQDTASSIMTTAKEFLQSNNVLFENPTYLLIPPR